jgi:hypothetical protein
MLQDVHLTVDYSHVKQLEEHKTHLQLAGSCLWMY